MKRITVLTASILTFALFAAGCSANAAQVASAETPAPIEQVVLEMDVSNVTPTPLLTPTIAPPTAAPTATPTATPVQTPSAANGTLELTLDQLKQYDGKNGNPAYIAVDGVIYDVSNVSRWKNGSHEGYSAGKDLTDAIRGKSPHGTSVLEGVPIVGKLIAG
jgi:predicted heme/steroid binding protein